MPFENYLIRQTNRNVVTLNCYKKRQSRKDPELRRLKILYRNDVEIRVALYHESKGNLKNKIKIGLLKNTLPITEFESSGSSG